MEIVFKENGEIEVGKCRSSFKLNVCYEDCEKSGVKIGCILINWYEDSMTIDDFKNVEPRLNNLDFKLEESFLGKSREDLIRLGIERLDKSKNMVKEELKEI